ncbi:acyltransferase family protein [Cellulomonas carbonis]|uniref:acyltransferase family protein n=1 Tax=Cellulomonas carbonis TaxID=1386092 RepID=UPI0009DFAF90|nr:acyltransferase [Cellulomonas carbonis]
MPATVGAAGSSRTRPRSVGVDLVRVLAIVAVVVGHVWDEPTVRSVVHPWHVPVFFVLSGYLWRGGRGVREELARRVPTLLVPYVAWLVVILAVVLGVTAARGGPVALGSVRDALLGGAYAGRPFSAFWFVTALLVTVVAYRVLDGAPRAVVWLVAGTGLLAGHVAGDALAAVPLSVGLALPCLVLVAAGAELARLRPRLAGRTVPFVGLGLVGVGAVAVAAGVSAPVDLKQVDLGTPVVSMVVAVTISAGLVLLAEWGTARVGRHTARLVLDLAAAGLMVVLSHALVLWLLGTPHEGRPLDAALALAVPWGVGLLLLRVPIASRVLLGRPVRPAVRPVA